MQQITFEKISPVMLIWHPLCGVADSPPTRQQEQLYKKFYTKGRKSGWTYKKSVGGYMTANALTYDQMYPSMAADIRAYLGAYEQPFVELTTGGIPSWEKHQSFDFTLFPKEVCPVSVFGSAANRETTGNVHMLCDFVATSRWECSEPIYV